ncbi:MAG: hypothetical protein IJP30_03760 [Clostridia bacterium]|nr:hypothetical protein [Clostridia bacterium]
MQTVLCYGDSNTWGHTPGTKQRYPLSVRWTGIAADLLGPEYRVIEEGLNGRTTVFDDPYKEYLNGKTHLSVALITHRPLNWVVLALGTNDLKFTNAYGSAKGAQVLVRMIRDANIVFRGTAPVFFDPPKILLVAPPLVGEQFGAVPERTELKYGHEESKHFAREYLEIAQTEGVYYLDASLYAPPSPTDGIHLDPPAHAALGEAIARFILKTDAKS